MSFDAAFGPPIARDNSRSARAAAVAWCRRSLFARLARNPHRSEIAVAVMYAAELAAGDAPAKAAKHAAGRAQLELLSPSDVVALLDVARASRDAAPDPLARAWADRACSVLSEIGAVITTRVAAPQVPYDYSSYDYSSRDKDAMRRYKALSAQLGREIDFDLPADEILVRAIHVELDAIHGPVPS